MARAQRFPFVRGIDGESVQPAEQVALQDGRHAFADVEQPQVADRAGFEELSPVAQKRPGRDLDILNEPPNELRPGR